MVKLVNLISKLKAYNEEAIILESLRRIEDVIVDLNRAQLMAGLNSKGGLLGTYRSKEYEEFKKYLNPKANGAVDLFLTGAFQESFFVELGKLPVTIFATDNKTGKLSEGYDFIFGLSPNSKRELRQFARPYIIEAWRKSVL